MALHLDSDLLRTFVAVAETGNFTRAATQVNRTQSAVSMQIKRLEDMVGEMLFSRGPRGVGLTRKGDELLSKARRIVSLLDETAASMSAPPLDGPVRIGIPRNTDMRSCRGRSALSQSATRRSRSRSSMLRLPRRWLRSPRANSILPWCSNGRIFRMARC